MKNFLILLAVVFVAAGAYWKFRDQIHGKIEEVKDETKGGGAPSVIPAIKEAISNTPTQPKAEEKLSLVSSDFIRGLPDSMANLSPEGGANRDLVLEYVAGDGTGGLPPQVRLTPNVWLDTSTIEFPGGVKKGTAILVHLQSVSPAGGNVAAPDHMVRCSAEPLPQPMEAGIRRDRWRATVVASGTPAPPPVMTTLWVTDFVRKTATNELQGTYLVEGTFASYQRAGGNASQENVTLEEAKNVKFFFSKGSTISGGAIEAEQIKKQGNRITLKLKVDVASTPKYLVQELAWCIPVKDQFDYWTQKIGGKGQFGHTLALAAWAETRNMADQAKSIYEKARGEITPASVTQLGAPSLAIRIHLADEVDDQWFYERVAVVGDVNHHPVWHQSAAKHGIDFVAIPKRPCVIFQTKAIGLPVGDYYLLQ